MKGAEKQGIDKTRLATMARKQAGVVLRPGLTAGQRRLETLTFFAPRFTAAIGSIFTDAARGNPEAIKTLGFALGAAVSGTIAANLLINGKMPNFTDPDKNDFGQVVTPEGRINLFGPYWSYLKAAAIASKGIATGDMGKALNGATGFFRGKSSTTIGPFIDFIVGSDMGGNKVERSARGLAEAYLGRIGPIGIRQIGEHALDVQRGEAKFMPSVLGEYVGLRTLPWTKYQQLQQLRDATAKRVLRDPKATWDALSPEQMNKVALDPELQKAEARLQSWANRSARHHRDAAPAARSGRCSRSQAAQEHSD